MTGFDLDLAPAGSSVSVLGNQQLVENVYAGYEIIIFDRVFPVDAALSVSTDVELPADAEIDRATFTVSAAAVEAATASSVADVRESEPPGSGTGAVTFDFGRLVTVGALYVSGADRLYRWDGTAFRFLVADQGAFPEVSTERLCAEFSDSFDLDQIRQHASVSLPAVPTGLELLIDGTTAWFERQGPSAGVDQPESDGVGYGIDRTDAFREAFARATPQDGTVRVRVELRALAPGKLSLGPRIGHHRVHVVAFPEGTARTVDRAEEGPFTVEVPLPADATGWTVDEVRMTLRGDFGDARILPAEGPAFDADALVVLAAGRTVLARLPAGLTAKFDKLSAVRVPIRSSSGDSEVAGRLLADASGRPGDVVRGGDLTPIRPAAGDEAAWTTMPTTAPVPVAGPLWLELTVNFGEVEWTLTANGADHATAPGAELYRRLAGGGVREFPTLGDLGPRLGAVRLVGEAPANQPIQALALDIGTGAPVELTPGGTDAHAVVGLDTPLQPASPAITLSALSQAGGSVTFTDVRVVYREGS